MTPEVKERIEQIRHGIVPEGFKKEKEWIFEEEYANSYKYLEDIVDP